VLSEHAPQRIASACRRKICLAGKDSSLFEI
jgi:hypothetical protein